jgi:hypothetical protein
MKRGLTIIVASLIASVAVIGCDEKAAEKKVEETAAAAEKKAESIVAGAMDAGNKATEKAGEAVEKAGEAVAAAGAAVEDAGLAAQGQKLVADLTAAIEKKDVTALPALLKSAEDLKAKLPADVQKTIDGLITKGKALLPAVPGM